MSVRNAIQLAKVLKQLGGFVTVSTEKQLPGAISTINPNFVIEGLAQELLFALTQLPGEASERQRKLGEELVRFFAALAPVPEVQGTPTKEVMPQCHKCGGESPWGDVCAGCLVGQGKCDLHVGWHKQIENCVRWEPAAPVGTPQKETPPMKPSNLLRENRSRELVWTIRTALGKLESQISRTPSLPEAYTIICNEAFDALRGLERLTMNLCDKHLEIQTMSVGPCPMCPAASVPEGVQGKEPQTFAQRYAEKDQALEERAWAYENTDVSDSVYSLLAGFALQERKAAYLEGEAAGRRWKLAIKEACIVNYINFYPEDAQKSLSNLIAWETKIALDPKASKEAAELLAAGRLSTITQIHERAYEEARAGNQIHAKDIADWCAELQEKTK